MLVHAPKAPLSQYAQRMKWLSNQILGKLVKSEHKDITNKKADNWRVVRYFSERPLHKKEGIADYYYPPYQQIDHLMASATKYGFFRNEHEDFVQEMERQRNMRGKTKFKRYCIVQK
ncbi:MAG: Mitochondrial ribosomal subunit S27, partial [Paramarteilia canceri]